MRLALLCSEPVRPAMAGIGIRYLELARRLHRPAVQTVLVSPGEPAEAPPLPGEVRRFVRGGLARLLADCGAAVAQGQLANDLLLECPSLPVAIDLYDPWLVENFQYLGSLGLAPFRNDHASWVLQMGRGDFFLCSSPEQRLFYLGFLTALGRVNPERVAADADCRQLVATVPFGLPAPGELPPHRPLLPDRTAGERRLLFGGLYDWYDPLTLLAALERLQETPWTLTFVANPNPESTPQALLAEVERQCRRRGWWQQRVRVHPWVQAERRWDLLRDADLLVAPHHPTLETRLSLRTRFLEALAVGCPVVVTDGGTVGRLLREAEAGWVVPPHDDAALASAVAAALGDGEEVARRRQRGLEVASRFAWERVLAPLLAWAADPRPDPFKDRFAFTPVATVPPDRLLRRVARRLGRLLPGGAA
ncbi:MAG TPA: glycosyltransferase family 4 protein [Thermoanaerobaculia bacterium]|nr:glycosyltransferase family 4 protein [Thermoanaerobaculia bacterium]